MIPNTTTDRGQLPAPYTLTQTLAGFPEDTEAEMTTGYQQALATTHKEAGALEAMLLGGVLLNGGQVQQASDL